MPKNLTSKKLVYREQSYPSTTPPLSTQPISTWLSQDSDPTQLSNIDRLIHNDPAAANFQKQKQIQGAAEELPAATDYTRLVSFMKTSKFSAKQQMNFQTIRQRVQNDYARKYEEAKESGFPSSCKPKEALGGVGVRFFSQNNSRNLSTSPSATGEMLAKVQLNYNKERVAKFATTVQDAIAK